MQVFLNLFFSRENPCSLQNSEKSDCKRRADGFQCVAKVTYDKNCRVGGGNAVDRITHYASEARIVDIGDGVREVGYYGPLTWASFEALSVGHGRRVQVSKKEFLKSEIRYALIQTMLKTEAIQILGGTASDAAKAIGITPQAISDWPDVLTAAIRDRVQAALYRKFAPNQPHPSAARSSAAIESEAA